VQGCSGFAQASVPTRGSRVIVASGSACGIFAPRTSAMRFASGSSVPSGSMSTTVELGPIITRYCAIPC